MPSQSKSAGSAVSDTGVSPYTDQAWVNPSYITADDSNYASITSNQFDIGKYSQRMFAYNFGFSIPLNATIEGILVEIKRYCGSGSVADDYIYLNSTGVVGNNKSAGASWPGIEQYNSFGGSTDLWGWSNSSPSAVNANNFGVHLACHATSNNSDIYVNHVRIIINYTEEPMVVTGAASLTGQGNVSAQGYAPVIGSSIEIAGQGDLSSGSIKVRQGSVTVDGTGALNGTSNLVKNGFANLEGQSYLSGDGIDIAEGEIQFSGQGDITGTGIHIINVIAYLEGISTLEGFGNQILVGYAQIDGSGNLQATSEMGNLDMTSLWEIQNAIYTILTNDLILMGKITGVFDNVPSGQSYPYVVIGEAKETSVDNFGKQGREATTTLHIWSQATSFEEPLSILDDLNRLLDRANLNLTRFVTIRCGYDSAETIRDPDGIRRHIPAKYKILVEEV
ncbi:DUF3168 domain-containing protein [Pelotomaculum propionicicum]|uniref:DUF3168 domain-containing protein n=1 Tax=Pelotomaculum propionicicum TaxID=258475 RepID=UPI003B8286EB